MKTRSTGIGNKILTATIKESICQTDELKLSNVIIDEFKGICEQIQDNNLKNQFKDAINKIYLYCDMLDEVKNANIQRIKQLDKIEMDQFERSIKFEQKILEMDKTQSSIKLSTQNMQKLLSSNTQGCQTDLNFSEMF